MSQSVSGQDCWTEAQGNKAQGSKPSRAGNAATLGPDGLELLTSTVKTEIIPRLVALQWKDRTGDPLAQRRAGLTHPNHANHPAELTPPLDRPSQIDDGMVHRLTSICLETDGQGVSVFVTELHRSGIGAQSIFEDLLTPVARELGVMWENDTCTFADVTIGVLRLQNAQRALTTEYLGTSPAQRGGPRALLLPVPGEQHTFGLSIVMDYFLRAGWDAWMGPAGPEADAISQVRTGNLDLVGLSYACDEHMPTARALIAKLRRASANPNLCIMVGGPSFSADPALAGLIGADATALDGHQAVIRANQLLHRPAERC